MMSQRQSRASRHSVYDEDKFEGEEKSATELRDSRTAAETTAADKDYGTTTPENETNEKLVETPTITNNNTDSSIENNEISSELVWKDKDGTIYRYYENPLISVCPFILVTEMNERLCYYGLTPTLKPFLKYTLGKKATVSVLYCVFLFQQKFLLFIFRKQQKF